MRSYESRADLLQEEELARVKNAEDEVRVKEQQYKVTLCLKHMYSCSVCVIAGRVRAGADGRDLLC